MQYLSVKSKKTSLSSLKSFVAVGAPQMSKGVHDIFFHPHGKPTTPVFIPARYMPLCSRRDALALCLWSRNTSWCQADYRIADQYRLSAHEARGNVTFVY